MSESGKPDEKEYMVQGRVTLDGVWFFIKAASLTAARARVNASDWDEYETNGAETVDWGMDPESLQENK